MARPSPELASALADLPVSPTHYEITGLAPTASTDEIRTAYNAWVAAAGTADAELSLAYAVLNDPLRRRVYDAYLLSHRRVMAHAGRWWRRPGFRRALRPVLTAAFMLAAIAFAGLQVWRAFTY